MDSTDFLAVFPSDPGGQRSLKFLRDFGLPPTLIRSPHSCFSATIGSTRDALRAGT